MAEKLLTTLDYVRMSPNTQSLICSLFEKVIYDEETQEVKIIDRLNCNQLLVEKLKQTSEGDDDLQFWRGLIDDFHKLVNSYQQVDKNNESFELFPSLTSNDDEQDSNVEEVVERNGQGNKITIERRWEIGHRTSCEYGKLDELVSSINNSHTDENRLIEIFQQLFENGYDRDYEFKHILQLGLQRIENPLVYHKIFEECLEIYYSQSDNSQLERLAQIVELFNFFIRILRVRYLDLCKLKNFLLFQVEYFLPITLQFCFSYHYKLRDAAIELLKALSEFPCLKESSILEIKENNLEWFKIIPEKQLIQDSLTLYVDLTDCITWMDKLGEETFKTHFLSVSFGEAKAIVKEYERWFFGTQTQSEEETILKELAQKINQVMGEFPNKEAFVKLSHRSPKDAAFKVNQYDSLVKDMVEQWSKLYGLEVDSSGDHTSLKHEKYQSAISQICAQKCMKVRSGEDFIKLMTISYRSHVDLSICLESDAAQHQTNDSIPIQIVIREWMDIPIWREVRTFIRNKKMTAMTQYFSSSFFPNVSLEEYQAMKRVILKYFEKVKHKIPLDDCCIDFVVIDLENEIVKIIELNSYGDNCGPAFFDWDKDRILLYNGPLEFRVATSSNIEKEYQII